MFCICVCGYLFMSLIHIICGSLNMLSLLTATWILHSNILHCTFLDSLQDSRSGWRNTGPHPFPASATGRPPVPPTVQPAVPRRALTALPHHQVWPGISRGRGATHLQVWPHGSGSAWSRSQEWQRRTAVSTLEWNDIYNVVMLFITIPLHSLSFQTVLFLLYVDIFMPPDGMIGGILILSCLVFVYFKWLSVITLYFWTVRDRNFIFGILH